MKRMWVRLTVAFTAVLLVVTILPSAVLFILAELGIDPFTPPDVSHLFPEDVLVSDFDDVIVGGMEEFYVFNIPLGQFLLLAAAGSTLLGLLAGIWVSRSVSRPVTQLAEAVRRIGARDLSRRVDVRGSQELVDLGREINRMAVNLEQAERIRRNLMADVAHELRTPLTVLQGNLRAMLDGVYDPSEEEIGRLFEQTHHLSRLVEDLRELALAEAGQLPLSLELTNLADLGRETAALFEGIAEEKGIVLTVEMDSAVPAIQVDRARIRQVLHNLLSNGLHHTPPGGHVHVGIHRVGSSIDLSVGDDGCGIDQADLPNIFDRFYRAESSHSRDTGGTGLGLAIAKAVVEAHGGHIEVHSSGLNRGSTFAVRLPLASSTAMKLERE